MPAVGIALARALVHHKLRHVLAQVATVHVDEDVGVVGPLEEERVAEGLGEGPVGPAREVKQDVLAVDRAVVLGVFVEAGAD